LPWQKRLNNEYLQVNRETFYKVCPGKKIFINKKRGGLYMADLKKSVLGKVSGALGDLVFRQTKTANVIAVRPKSFMPGMDQASIDRREKFRISVKLASAINKIPELYQVWNDHDSKRAPFQNLIISNYPYIDPSGTPGKFKMTPEEGFGTKSTLLSISSDEIHAELEALPDNAGIDIENEVGIKLVSLICLTNPLDEFAPALRFIRSVSEEQSLELGSSMVFSVPLMSQETELYNSYSDCDAYFALVTLDAEGNVVRYSNTFRKSS
jgi:hypothetical protein